MSIPTDKKVSKVTYNGTEIPLIDGTPTEIDTSAGMTAVLIEDNLGKCYKYTGTTTSDYTNGDLYIVGYPDYLCFTANANTNIAFTVTGTLTTTPVIYYSLDRTTWNSYTFGNTVSLTSGESCYWRGDNDSFSEVIENYITFSSTGSVAASGNIMSLLDSTCASTTIPCEGCFTYLFNDCTSLTTAPALPATTLASYCYDYMFSGCTSLTSAPALPATTLADCCYSMMFYNCTSLTTAPALPATTLANYCYSMMFYNCTSLTTAPALPATTLADYCYYNMFKGCTSLTTAPALPATTLASNCYNSMFYGCSSLQVYSSSGTGHICAWRIPTSGTASSYTYQAEMFHGTIGDYASVTVILNNTFYTQNAPVA